MAPANGIGARLRHHWMDYRARRTIFPSYPERLRTGAQARCREEAEWQRFGLDRKAAEARLVAVSGRNVLDEINSGRSELSKHTLLFAGIAASDSPVRNVLEIGTFKGTNTLFLARLFPQATINTLDLVDDDPLVVSSYGREDADRRARLIGERSGNLRMAPNIRFHQFNSVLMMERLEGEQLDLIWIDGDHSFPVVAFDVISAFRLAAPGAWLMLDDVFPTPHELSPGEDVYHANHGFLALEYLRRHAGFDYGLFMKRESAFYGRRLKWSKFVAAGRRPG